MDCYLRRISNHFLSRQKEAQLGVALFTLSMCKIQKNVHAVKYCSWSHHGDGVAGQKK